MTELSVVLLCRDQAPVLQQSLASLVRDRGTIQQLIVIDDASRDDTQTVIAALNADLPPHEIVRRSVPAGLVSNLKEGLLRATGRYVFFLAADDDILPGFFDQSLALLRAHPLAGLCSSRTRLSEADGSDLGVFETPLPVSHAGFVPPDACKAVLFRSGSWYMGNTTIFRKQALEDAGGFDPDLDGFADAYACLSIALRHGACFIPDALGTKRDIQSGMGSRIHEDASRSMSIWRHARRLLAVEHSPPFDRNLLDRMEMRWRFEIARFGWRRRLDWAGHRWPAAVALKTLFFFARACLLARYKPFDMLDTLRRL